MTDFEKLIQDIEEEARAEGPAAVAELAAFDAQFELASQLLAARREAKLTQKELAERTGIQQAEISRIERAQVVPKVTTMNRLLRPLGRHLAVVRDDEPTAA